MQGAICNFPVETNLQRIRGRRENCALNCSRLYTKPKPAMRPFEPGPSRFRSMASSVAWRSTCERSMHLTIARAITLVMFDEREAITHSDVTQLAPNARDAIIQGTTKESGARPASIARHR